MSVPFLDLFGKFLDAAEQAYSSLAPKLTVLRQLAAANRERALSAYVGLILDQTWEVETNAIDAQFTGAALSALPAAVALLDSVEPLCVALLADKAGDETLLDDFMIDTLGDEVCEALHWRRGALPYMFFSCRVKADDSASLATCSLLATRGIYEFERMLYSRRRLARSVAGAPAGRTPTETELEMQRMTDFGIFR